jgi:hypothetical protein
MGLDAIYQFKPDKQGEPGEVGIKYKAEDKFSKLILNEITSIPSELKIDQFIFTGDKEKNERFTATIFSLTDSLFKANSHRKEYKTKLKIFEKKFRRSLYNDSNKKNLDITSNPLELVSDFDGFLTQIKASLDNLACGLNPLLETNFNRWAKGGKDNKSGAKIINHLKNLHRQITIDNLIEYLDKTQDQITYIVNLRDKPLHKGGNNNLSGFVFHHNNRNISRPAIKHPDGHQEEIGDYIDKTMQNFILFTSKVILFGIQHNAKTGFTIRRVSVPNGDTQYEWSL